ncbi:chaperone NapD [Parasedimentitalea huanghaiensis]|uniref:Chaperone NapD n=1 Tax=Parasedimentitalea huanghaiensis TaxID=2682100 RepID=A0A6L6W9A9_9RHOB|nr:chaperone NapD [Zongyanglinia huanghaiensis]MVO14274.1 nitrate reductase formation protein NapD [Zongyanglinia huanghaiensis]
MPEDVIHISSLLIRADPALMHYVLEEIAKVPNAEVPLSDASGKIIVTLETPSESEIVDSLTNLQLLDGVVSAALIYHQADSETAEITIRNSK